MMTYEQFRDMMYSRGWNYSKPAMRIAYIGYVEAQHAQAKHGELPK